MSDSSGIGSYGSIALLVSSMTGPGLATIPAMYQQAGWAAPTFIFLIIGFLSGCSALFVCEALSNIRGNEKFQAKIELTTIAQVYLGKKYHYFFQFMLYVALQAVNISSIILAAQTFDNMLITIFKGTCGLGVNPGGWFCTTSQSTQSSSPFNTEDYFIFTFGYLLTAVMVIPLGFFSLVENIAVQMISFIMLIAILIQWLVAFGQEGFKPELLPASGTNVTTVLGIVIFNFSYITTIPSWVNSLKPSVNVHRVLWISVIVSSLFYIILGICGAMAFDMPGSSDILSILSATGKTPSLVTAYLFPVVALVTSIPVFTIVIRSNLLRGQICNRSWSIFWSNFLPWIVCIPLQTKDYVGTIQNWSSLFFQSTVNFILPFILYFVSRRIIASVQNISKEEAPLPSTPLPPLSPRPDTIKSHRSNKHNMNEEQEIIDQKNSVIMYNPEDDCAISIRRSSIAPSGIHSRLEYQQSPFSRSPRFPLSSRLMNHSVISRQSMLSPPTSPYFMNDNPTTAANNKNNNNSMIPTIVCNNNNNNNSNIQPIEESSKLDIPPHSPHPAITVEEHQETKLLTTNNNNSNNNNNTSELEGQSRLSSQGNSTLVSTNGLGISHQQQQPSSSPLLQSNNNNTNTNNNIIQTPANAFIPSSPQLGYGLSPDINKINTPTSSPHYHPHQQQHHQSMITSVLSVRSAVAPYHQHHNVHNQPIHEKSIIEQEDENKQIDVLSMEQVDKLRGKFIAFQQRPWFNPFYLAVFSSVVLALAIVFMIIYSIVLLGMGQDIFGE
ncbi:hypothetical protein BJ944DRAFT_291577 [Cunninghamella echinulata]|nr:hypothetical protein BJ944DRAFT_291577 [Cunninghamella echinulata]